MTAIRAHFDGRSVVLDEPAELKVGQRVRVVVDDASPASAAEGGLIGEAGVALTGEVWAVEHFSSWDRQGRSGG